MPAPVPSTDSAGSDQSASAKSRCALNGLAKMLGEPSTFFRSSFINREVSQPVDQFTAMGFGDRLQFIEHFGPSCRIIAHQSDDQLGRGIDLFPVVGAGRSFLPGGHPVAPNRPVCQVSMRMPLRQHGKQQFPCDGGCAFGQGFQNRNSFFNSGGRLRIPGEKYFTQAGSGSIAPAAAAVHFVKSGENRADLWKQSRVTTPDIRVPIAGRHACSGTSMDDLLHHQQAPWPIQVVSSSGRC